MTKEEKYLHPDPGVTEGEKTLDELASELGVNTPSPQGAESDVATRQQAEKPQPEDVNKIVEELNQTPAEGPEEGETIREIKREDVDIPLDIAADRLRPTSLQTDSTGDSGEKGIAASLDKAVDELTEKNA